MSLINDLLEDLESTIWYCSLDMASGFWVVKMTDRARFSSAYITPFGLNEWNWMPFGLENAPQIYQRMIDNALYGFTRIPKSEDHGGTLDVFEDGEPVDPGKRSVLGRRSYIDDILIPANNWNQLCDRVEGLREACDKWNLAINVVKCFWGMPKVECLGQKVSHNGLKTNPKNLSALTDLAFPESLRAMQSFLGSLKYYSLFIEDYAIYASVLYELREIDFVAMMKEATQARIQQILEVENVNQGSQEDQGVDHRKTWDLEAPDPSEVDRCWIHAHRSFSVLKARIATTPIFQHFHPDRKATVVVYASDWTISGSLMQDYDQIYYPVMFASRTLKSNELNSGIEVKEVLALLTILDLNYNALVGRPIHVLTRHSTLAWLFMSAALQGHMGQSEKDKALISFAPKKEPRRKVQAPIPTIRRDEELYVISFDGSARVKRGGGAYSAILWKLPEWRVLKVRSGYAENLTVNEAEYRGLFLCLDRLEDLDPRRLVICGGSNLVIRQVRGEIDYHELLHAKRYWNGNADSLASTALQRQCGTEIETEKEIQDLVTLNWLNEILIVKIEDEIAQISTVTTRSKARSGVPDPARQDEESWILGLKKYLVGEIRDLTQEDAKMFGSIDMNYEVDQSDLLFYYPTTKKAAADRDKWMRLVIPETLQQDILHHGHMSLQGDHQGVVHTYDRIRDHFHWRELYKSVQRYVGECADCETDKSRPRIEGESRGNLQATYPFQIIAMDHIPSLLRSLNGNTELLIFVDLFSGYVIAKASASRSAQTIAETYKECIFRRFGASEVTRHDREPGFMPDFFKPFNKIPGQRQRATMAYQLQANGSAGRMVQTTTKALKMYVQDLD
ncbi:reverse transcriptase [Phytophthora megakarya]|uniref:Reverse transcriptase n=1 Tax=Phytophthora megakarya TaxID=4795 RepID=A0A225VL16_9STRA|nr:reverse transcriptase [Phytophthora megakarya]